ncbi:MAG TPA: hypothetical protein VJV78_21280, partial [Polyangiales bacterium]|nr:hypothetical protein [Polyangiales bacterium]
MLLVGSGVLADSLAQHLTTPELKPVRTPRERLLVAMSALEPELIILIADAAKERGGPVLEELGSEAPPVVVVCAAHVGVLEPKPLPPRAATLTPEGGMVECARRLRVILGRVVAGELEQIGLQQIADETSRSASSATIKAAVVPKAASSPKMPAVTPPTAAAAASPKAAAAPAKGTQKLAVAPPQAAGPSLAPNPGQKLGAASPSAAEPITGTLKLPVAPSPSAAQPNPKATQKAAVAPSPSPAEPSPKAAVKAAVAPSPSAVEPSPKAAVKAAVAPGPVAAEPLNPKATQKAAVAPSPNATEPITRTQKLATEPITKTQKLAAEPITKAQKVAAEPTAKEKLAVAPTLLAMEPPKGTLKLQVAPSPAAEPTATAPEKPAVTPNAAEARVAKGTQKLAVAPSPEAPEPAPKPIDSSAAALAVAHELAVAAQDDIDSLSAWFAEQDQPEQAPEVAASEPQPEAAPAKRRQPTLLGQQPAPVLVIEPETHAEVRDQDYEIAWSEPAASEPSPEPQEDLEVTRVAPAPQPTEQDLASAPVAIAEKQALPATHLRAPLSLTAFAERSTPSVAPAAAPAAARAATAHGDHPTPIAISLPAPPPPKRPLIPAKLRVATYVALVAACAFLVGKFVVERAPEAARGTLEQVATSKPA